MSLNNKLSLFKRLSLKYAIYKENKKIARMVRQLGRLIKANPELKTEQISEENKKKSVDALQNIIKYKMLLGLNVAQEQTFLNELNK